MKSQKRYSLTPDSTNLILLTSPKGQEIGEQFTMNLLGAPREAMDLPEEQKGKIFLQLVEICKKLSKLANAVDKYAEEEAKLVKELKEKVKKDGRRIAHHSDILEAAVEEVVGQAKSTLDVAVKIFDPLYGIKLHTYGDNGEKVVKALKNNIPEDKKEKINTIIQVIEQFKPYSESIIGLRTTTQHYKNIQMSPLIVELGRGSDYVVSLPHTSGKQKASEFTEITYHNIFVFIRDLITFSFASQFYDGLIPVLIEEKGPRIKKIGVTIAEGKLKK